MLPPPNNGLVIHQILLLPIKFLISDVGQFFPPQYPGQGQHPGIIPPHMSMPPLGSGMPMGMPMMHMQMPMGMPYPFMPPFQPGMYPPGAPPQAPKLVYGGTFFF